MDSNAPDEEPKGNEFLLESPGYMELWKLHKAIDEKIKELNLKKTELSSREAALAEITTSDLNKDIPVLLGGVYTNMNGLSAQEYLVFEIKRAHQVIQEIEEKLSHLKNELWARLV